MRILNTTSHGRLRLPFLFMTYLMGIGMPSEAAPFDAIRGSWRGAVQMDERSRADAHTVGPLQVHIGVDGAIDAIHANGCKLSGVVQPFTGATVFSLDLRMKACAYQGFNRRWKGTLRFQPDFRSASLELSAFDLPVPLQRHVPRSFDAKGTLAR